MKLNSSDQTRVRDKEQENQIKITTSPDKRKGTKKTRKKKTNKDREERREEKASGTAIRRTIMNWHFWGRKLFYHITVPIPLQNGIHWICPYGGSRKHLFQIENN